MASPHYSYRLYNEHDVLRIRWYVLAIFLYLVRHILLLFVIGVSHGRGGGANPEVGQLAALIDPVFLPADAPGLILLFGAGARIPSVGAVPRWLWRQGRIWMLASVAIFLGAMLWKNGVSVERYAIADYLEIALNIGLAVYTLRSRYLRDMFAQFPAPPAKTG